MKIIRFTIRGNHKSQTGNPMPKLKMTGKQHWTPRAREYVQWKEHIVYSLLDAIKADPEMSGYRANVARHGKPFILGPVQHAFMTLRIQWSNKAHGDPENVFGSIADALFHNDKNLDCLTVSYAAQQKENGKPIGCVGVKVRIFDSEKEKIDFLSGYNII